MPSSRAMSLPSNESAPCGGRYHFGSTPVASATVSCARHVVADRPRAHALLAAVVGVHADLVARGRDLGREPGRRPHHVAEHEERRPPPESRRARRGSPASRPGRGRRRRSARRGPGCPRRPARGDDVPADRRERERRRHRVHDQAAVEDLLGRGHRARAGPVRCPRPRCSASSRPGPDRTSPVATTPAR